MKIGTKALLRALSVSLALLAVPALGSGCGPSWTVVRQAAPNPMSATSEFAIEPVRFDGLRVGDKPEADYLAGKEDQQKEAWRNDLVQVNQHFQASLIQSASGLKLTQGPPAAPGPFVIKPHVFWVEPGYYAAIASQAATVDASITITDAQGAPIDEFRVHVVSPVNLVMGVPTNPSVTDRFRECGQKLGEVVAAYLKARTRPGK
jgi:hypothetical protein